MKNKFFIFAFITMFAIVNTANAKDKKNTKKCVTFEVSLHCQSCVESIQRNISFEKGVKDLDVNLDKKTSR
ncbi:MAG: heavy metal-associated domain-containing protein [Paludibacteraceae bacterium]